MEQPAETAEEMGEIEWSRLWSEVGTSCGRTWEEVGDGSFGHRMGVPKRAGSTHVLPNGSPTEVKVFMGAPAVDED